MQESVAVVIPVYNRYPMLLEALHSALAQTVPPREIVVVDDGSTDVTPRCVADILALDPRIRYQRIDHCGRPGAVRNLGVELCGSEWVALLDSDDLWLPHKLERQLECAAADPDAALVHTRERWLRGSREVSQHGQTQRRAGWIFPDALARCIIGPSTVLIRRRLYRDLGGFRADLEIAEDYEFWLRITAFHRVAYVDEALVDKRAGHDDQLSEKYGHIERFRIDGLLRLVEDGYFLRTPDTAPPAPDAAPEVPPAAAATTELQRLASTELARKCAIYAAGAAKRNRAAEAEHYRSLEQRYGG